MYSVYALTDPRDESIRYIGMSKNAWRRYAMHLLIPRKTTDAKNAWIEELRKLDLSPLLLILETMETESDAMKRESYWIQHHLKLNAPLLNMIKTGKAMLAREKPTDLSLARELTRREEFLTVEEIAEAAEVSADTVLRLIKKKQLAAHKISGVWRITPADFQRYLDSTRNIQPDQES